MVARDVAEAGAGRRRRRAPGPRGHLVEQAVDQDRGLVAGQRFRGQERAVGEAGLEPGIRQLLDSAHAPVGGLLPLDDEEGNTDGEHHGSHGEPTKGRTIERSHTGTTSPTA